MDFIEGSILCFDKPYGWTSFDLVRKIRSLLSKKLKVKKLKVGHAGTLDPLATGVMVVCTGKCTKKIEELQSHDKEYIATIELGRTTPSFDLEKDTDATYPYSHITKELLLEKLNGFLGESDQIPPIFSAIKKDGARAYELARAGENIDLKPKRIHISEIELLKYELPEIVVRIKCSKGTYIRAIARDLGVALSSGGCLINLRRTAVGDYNIESALSVKDFEEYINNINI